MNDETKRDDEPNAEQRNSASNSTGLLAGIKSELSEHIDWIECNYPELQTIQIKAALSVICELEKDSRRYRFLRERDLDAITDGGIFAGKTPENVVLNGSDLDQEIDASLSC